MCLTAGFLILPVCILPQAVGSNALDAGKEISIVAVGDVMLGSHVIGVIEQRGVEYPFAKTSGYLESAHVAIANLEAPFTSRGEPFEKKFNFKVPPRFARSLVLGGIDAVTLANNHTLDYGLEGLSNTMETLDTLGVFYSGAGMNAQQAHEPVVLNVDGKRVALFGYSMTFPTEFYATKDSVGTAYPEPERLRASLTKWRDKVDFIVTSFHWGAEKRETPKQYQVEFAHLAIDSGSDLVLGHHPHVLQGLEIYKDRLIAYSLGNFAFGSYSRHAADSIILKVYLGENGLVSAFCVPINVNNVEVEFQPVLAGGERKKAILAHLRELSQPLNGDRQIIRNSGLILGEWSTFFDDWLLETASNSYWKGGEFLFSTDTRKNGGPARPAVDR